MSTATQITTRVGQLRNNWAPRNAQMKRWYDLIRLFNDLYQDKMESVISSDPRTGYNMAAWLLMPKASSFLADVEGWEQQEVRAAAPLQDYADMQLVRTERETEQGLFGSYMHYLIKTMLATGWYCVISFPTNRGWFTRAWNPASVFPEYDGDFQLIEVGRIYTITANEAMRKASMAFNSGEPGWLALTRKFTGNVTMYNHWRRSNGVVEHAVVMNEVLVKDYTPIPLLDTIPIYTAPLAGLPDDGSIMGGVNWRAEIGQAVVAPIADLQKNMDKMLTYMQQLIRDVANPRWVEKVRGSGVLTAERLYERGAIFTVEPGEDVLPIPTPALPGEMRMHSFDVRNMIQRGLFSDISFGSSTQAVSAFMMSQVTAASQQILDPFHVGIKTVNGAVATNNLRLMRRMGMTLNGIPFPADLPEMFTLGYDYGIQIPGDFLQRANSAKIINPEFKLSSTTLINILFPEVRSALIEKGNVDAEDAMKNPIVQALTTVNELEAAAEEARQAGNEFQARRIERAAKILEQQALGEPAAGEEQVKALTNGKQAAPTAVQELLGGRS